MKLRIMGLVVACAALLAWTACATGKDEAQHWDTTTGAPQQRQQDRTVLNQQSGMAPVFEARVLNEDALASQNRAQVEVTQRGLNLVSPDQPPTPNDATKGYIEYSVDGGAAQYTSQSPFTLAALNKGEHTVSVRLVDTEKHPLTESKVMKVKIGG